MTTLTKIRLDGVEYDLGGGSSVDLSEYVKKVQDTSGDVVNIQGGTSTDLGGTLYLGGSTSADGSGGWELGASDGQTSYAWEGLPDGKIHLLGFTSDGVKQDTVAYLSDLSNYALTSSLGSLASKSSITHSEVSDWSTATASFLTSHQDLNGWLPQAVAKANTDLDTIVEQGVYNVSTSSANSSAHHYPVGTNGIMIVLRTNATAGQGFCQQFFRRTGTAGTNDHHWYIREAGNGGTGAWGAWVQVMTSKNLSTNGGTIATTSYVDDAIAAITDADSTGY